jgi:hypothetical protein
MSGISSQSKNFVVTSLSKCSISGDLDCPVIYTNDPDFSEGLAYLGEGRTLGGRSQCNDSCNVKVQFQQRGTVESLGAEDGVIRSDTGSSLIRFSFKACDLYFNAVSEHDPYNFSWADLHVGDTVFFIPFRNRGVLRKGSQCAPALQRALSVTRHERVITCRIGSSVNVPQGAIAIPKWMWPSLCPLTAAESSASAAASPSVSSPAAPSTSSSSSAAAADESSDAAKRDAIRAQFLLDGLRERTVRVTLVFSSNLPVITSARLHCLSKQSLNPSVPAPNFTELTSWFETFLFLTQSGVRAHCFDRLTHWQ